MSALLVQITVYDEDTGAVSEQIVETYTGSYGYEVVSMFEKLGERLAPKADPYYHND